MSKSPSHPQEKLLHELKRGESEFELLILPEEKNIAWLKAILYKSTNPGNLVLEASAGTFFIDKAYLLLPKHRIFIGYDMESSCVTEMMPQLISLYARRLLSKKSDIDGKE